MNWIKTKENLPDEGVNVLAIVFGEIKIMALCRIDDDDNNTGLIWGQVYDGLDGDVYIDDDYDVTHWIPLPEKPKQD